MNSSWASIAARNNADWCDTVCRSHGKPGEFYPDIWINPGVTPPYYPNAVTLTDGSTAAAKQYEAVAKLMDRRIPGDWAVKDSFNSLDLSGHSFRELLSAEWIYGPASLKILEVDCDEVSWARIADPNELLLWEIAWRKKEGPPGSSIFLPALLENDRQAIFRALQEGQIVAGCIANKSANAVDISNIFVPTEHSESFRAGCVAAALRWSNGLPLVGYESGSDLEAMKALGFESVGCLTIWVRSSQA